jgi:hypothetical protein
MFKWSPRTGQYIDSRGRFVARTRVRAALDQAIKQSGLEMRRLTESLRAGQIGVTEWQLRMMQEIKSGQIASAAIARGGTMQLNRSDLGRIGSRVREQYAYLQGFANEIESGKQRLDGTILRRTELYAQVPRATYHVFERIEREEHGMDLERSVLAVSDHCDLCVSEAGRGWVPVGELIPIGQRTCLSRCRCSVQYKAA